MSYVLAFLLSCVVMIVMMAMFSRLFDNLLLGGFVAWVLLIVIAEVCSNDTVFKAILSFGGPVLLVILFFPLFLIFFGE